jgi:UDP-3-O-[3-hydroxymyristoyl] glucosamine N-acyltransferase
MSVRADEILEIIGDLCRAVYGDVSRRASVVRPLNAPVAGCLTYAKANIGIERLGASDLCGCIIVCGAEHSELTNISSDRTLIATPNPRLAFIRVVGKCFSPARPARGIHPTAIVDATAVVDPSASIGPYVVIGADCEIGPDVVLHPHVTLYSNVRIARGSVVNAGSVIGADGFGYERNEQGILQKFPHFGGVVLGEDVEIGSNTSIDRGTLGDTIIEARARIDNQVHIAHNVRVGADSAVIAQSMLGGGVTIGRGGWVAPSASILNQVKVGAAATVGMAAAVVKNVPDGTTVAGSPAVDIKEFRETRKSLKKLLQRPSGTDRDEAASTK